MSIEIYSKAETIKKDGITYYFLKHHSKNDCVCRHQSVIDGNFNTKFLMRDGRGGSWSIKAHAPSDEYQTQIAFTCYNAPTSYMYGQIQFGNKKNIALFWRKHKIKSFEGFNEVQQTNISKIIDWYNKSGYKCDLSAIPADKEYKTIQEYCGKNYTMKDYSIEYKGQHYWNLDNL